MSLSDRSSSSLEPLHTRGTHKVRFQDDSEWDFYLDVPKSTIDMSLILPHYRARHQPVDHRMSMFVAGNGDPIKVKVCRNSPGIKFYLEILAESSDVTVWLPSDFKGQIHHTLPTTTKKGKASYSSGFVNRIMRNAQLNESDFKEHIGQDDVVVVTSGTVTFKMWDVQTGNPENCHKETLKRFFGCSKKAPETSIDWDFLLKD
ncbi:hypothetical protein CPB83DRAFT_866977 [Crepidotus variabilis]|uniref:DUF7330 domain-containing protein n=1 Tax=Crepidotus variabilis TaxID=179855 RepID=A0A9P6ERH7_9AGAR|nr:hypothetical protein CPB83DRAFT_866977 [Crepidotus variabilis]